MGIKLPIDKLIFLFKKNLSFQFFSDEICTYINLQLTYSEN